MHFGVSLLALAVCVSVERCGGLVPIRTAEERMRRRYHQPDARMAVSDIQDVPYHVQVLRTAKLEEGEETYQTFSGVIIHKSYVLTTGDCMTPERKGITYSPRNFFITAGQSQVYKNKDITDGGEHYVSVIKIHHLDKSPKGIVNKYSAALMKTALPMKLSNSVGIARFPTKKLKNHFNNLTLQNEWCLITSWYKVKPIKGIKHGRDLELKTYYVKLINLTTCMELLENSNLNYSDFLKEEFHVCSICEADLSVRAGSGLICEEKDPRVWGMASFNLEGSNETSPMVHIRVDALGNFINETINNARRYFTSLDLELASLFWILVIKIS